MRHTKILATIGPATEAPEMIERLYKLGGTAYRMNFSHGTHEWHKAVLDRIRALEDEYNTPLTTLLDTKGPETRIGIIDGEMCINKDTVYKLSGIKTGTDIIPISYKGFSNDCYNGLELLIDSGMIRMIVNSIDDDIVYARATNDGILTSKRHITLPGVHISLPTITDLDRKDIIWGAINGVDYIALSFVRTKNDVLEVRKILDDNGSKAKIISKIENQIALNNIEELLEVSDGIMIARGDLGDEIPLPMLPIVQRMLMKRAQDWGKITIIATQMMESMMNNPIPTRAEVSDIAEAAWQMTDCTMLSGETAMGKYPLDAVKQMAEVLEATEYEVRKTRNSIKTPYTSYLEELSEAAVAMLKSCPELRGIIINDDTDNKIMRYVSRYKPIKPVYKRINNVSEGRVCGLYGGVFPVFIDQHMPIKGHYIELSNALQLVIKEHITGYQSAPVPLNVRPEKAITRGTDIHSSDN